MKRKQDEPKLLRTPIDSSWDEGFQVGQRFSAIFQLYDIPKWDRNRFELLAIAMSRERFPKAFRRRIYSMDSRCKVVHLDALLKFIEALKTGDLSRLSPELQTVGKRVVEHIKNRDQRVNLVSICKAISRIPGSPWHKLEAATLRDNILRAPGSRSSKLAAQETNKKLMKGLEHTAAEIRRLPESDD